jgi:hypothetical protein
MRLVHHTFDWVLVLSDSQSMICNDVNIKWEHVFQII